jgi:hypothetical protein
MARETTSARIERIWMAAAWCPSPWEKTNAKNAKQAKKYLLWLFVAPLALVGGY